MGREKEIWKPIRRYTGFYEVSNCGKVRRLDRIVTIQFYNSRGTKVIRHSYLKGRILKRYRHKGYNFVHLCRNGIQANTRVTFLVVAAFKKKINRKSHINHLNRIKSDDRAKNLELVNNRENASHGHLKRKRKTSKYIGVSWEKWSNKWRAQMYVNGKNKKFGRFDDERKASQAYKDALREYGQQNKYAA